MTRRVSLASEEHVVKEKKEETWRKEGRYDKGSSKTSPTSARCRNTNITKYRWLSKERDHISDITTAEDTLKSTHCWVSYCRRRVTGTVNPTLTLEQHESVRPDPTEEAAFSTSDHLKQESELRWRELPRGYGCADDCSFFVQIPEAYHFFTSSLLLFFPPAYLRIIHARDALVGGLRNISSKSKLC